MMSFLFVKIDKKLQKKLQPLITNYVMLWTLNTNIFGTIYQL